MRTCLISLAAATLALSASSASDVAVTVHLITNEQVAGKLVQYVGGEFIIEEAGAKRVSIDARVVRAIYITGPRMVDAPRGRRLGMADGSARLRREGAPEPERRPDRPEKEASGKPTPLEPEAAKEAREKIARMLAKLETLDMHKGGSAHAVRDVMGDLLAEADRLGERDAVLKRFADRAEGAEEGTIDKVRWCVFAHIAHREAKNVVQAMAFRRQAALAADKVEGGRELLRMMPPDRGDRGGRGWRRGR